MKKSALYGLSGKEIRDYFAADLMLTEDRADLKQSCWLILIIPPHFPALKLLTFAGAK